MKTLRSSALVLAAVWICGALGFWMVAEDVLVKAAEAAEAPHGEAKFKPIPSLADPPIPFEYVDTGSIELPPSLAPRPTLEELLELVGRQPDGEAKIQQANRGIPPKTPGTWNMLAELSRSNNWYTAVSNATFLGTYVFYGNIYLWRSLNGELDHEVRHPFAMVTVEIPEQGWYTIALECYGTLLAEITLWVRDDTGWTEDVTIPADDGPFYIGLLNLSAGSHVTAFVVNSGAVRVERITVARYN